MNPGGMQESCNVSHRICKYKNFLRSYRVSGVFRVVAVFNFQDTPASLHASTRPSGKVAFSRTLILPGQAHPGFGFIVDSVFTVER